MIPFRRFKMGKCSNFNFSQFVLFLFLFDISYRDGYRMKERTRERAAMKRREGGELMRCVYSFSFCLGFIYLFVCLFLAVASIEAEEKREREKETTRIIIIKAWETSMRQIDR